MTTTILLLFFLLLLLLLLFYIYRPQKYIWHGSFLSGERAIDLYCDAWDTSSADRIGLASSLLSSKLLGQERFSCNHRFAVLCVEAASQPAKRKRRRSTNEDRLEMELKEEEYHKFLNELLQEKD